MKKIIIAGGSGFLGTCLSKHFVAKGYQVVILSRKNHLNQGHIHYVSWDAKNSGAWKSELEGAEALINLTGKSVDCRYTDANKQMIYNSRLESTHILGEVIQTLKQPPKVWINAASATIYRHALDRNMDEETGELGNGFSEDVCKKWERIFQAAETPEARKVILRIAIVLGRQGGALTPLKNLVNVGFGGRQGDGNQFVSWLHEKDFTGIIDHVIENEHIQGVYNASSPNPVSNFKMMKALRKTLGMSFGLPMPEWLLKIGAVLIRTETELVLKSRRVVSTRLMSSGFQFQYKHIDEALRDLIKG